MRISKRFSVLAPSLLAKVSQMKHEVLSLLPRRVGETASKARLRPSFRKRKLQQMLPSFLTVLVLAGLVAAAATPHVVAANLAWFGQNTEVGCLALNNFRERAIAGKEFPKNSSSDELMAFSWVVRNRLAIGFRQTGHDKPQTLCDVVWAGSESEAPQFSWTNWSDEKKFRVSEKHYAEFLRAFWAADAVLRETPDAIRVREMIGWADHYANLARVSPGWAKRVQIQGGVGYHTFFVDNTRNEAKRGLAEAKAILGQ